MDYMIVKFKSGNSIKVTQFVANALKDRVLSPSGAKDFQFFSEEQSEDTALCIKLSEVECIIKHQNII